MTGEPARLMPETDRLSAPDPQSPSSALEGDSGMMLRRRGAHKTLDIKLRGGDPLTETSTLGGPIPWQVEIERRWWLEKQRNKQMNEAVFSNPDSGWSQVKQGMDDIFAQYKERNEQKLIKKPRNEEEAMAQMAQIE